MLVFIHIKSTSIISFNDCKLNENNYCVFIEDIQRDKIDKMRLLLSKRLCFCDGWKPMEYCRKWFGMHVYSFEMCNFQSSGVFKVCFIIISCVFVNICGESFDRCQLIQSYFREYFSGIFSKHIFHTSYQILKQHNMFDLCVIMCIIVLKSA